MYLLFHEGHYNPIFNENFDIRRTNAKLISSVHNLERDPKRATIVRGIELYESYVHVIFCFEKFDRNQD